mgnify:CR=1 FL=1
MISNQNTSRSSNVTSEVARYYLNQAEMLNSTHDVQRSTVSVSNYELTHSYRPKDDFELKFERLKVYERFKNTTVREILLKEKNDKNIFLNNQNQGEEKCFANN